MAPQRENGIICINTALLDHCEGCLWLEWDPRHQVCLNQFTPLCSCRSSDLIPAPAPEAETPKLSRPRTSFCRLP